VFGSAFLAWADSLWEEHILKEKARVFGSAFLAGADLFWETGPDKKQGVRISVPSRG